jgi:hypothetical protein
MNINGSMRNNKSTLSYNFDVLSGENTLIKFINLYTSPTIPLSDVNIFDESGTLDESIQVLFKNVIENEQWKYINDKSFTDALFCKSKIGDDVTITYIPASQKNIDYYDQQTFSGKIIFIDNECQDMIIVNTDHGECTIKSLVREGCHFLGMSQGYYHYIKKLNVFTN